MKLLSILVVDDHAEILKLLRIWLEARGHQVTCVSSGNRALKLFDARSFDLVVTDVLMPDGGGIELIAQLKRTYPLVRILAITGGGPHVTSSTCLHFAHRVGVHALLLKPFKEAQLSTAIRQIFEAEAEAGRAPRRASGPLPIHRVTVGASATTRQRTKSLL
jgi:CheY-like chemotaxis protein